MYKYIYVSFNSNMIKKDVMNIVMIVILKKIFLDIRVNISQYLFARCFYKQFILTIDGDISLLKLLFCLI